MLSKEIQDEILNQTEIIYSKAKPNLSREDLKQRIEVFSMVLNFADTYPEKENRNIEKEIYSIFYDLSKARTVDVKNIEKTELLLRLLYFVIEPAKFNDKDVKTAKLASLYKLLDILQTNNRPERKDYYNILFSRDIEKDKYYEYEDSKHPENILKDDLEILPFVMTYCGRNTIAHEKPTPDKWGHFMSMFYTLIETSYKYKSIIIKKYNKKEISFSKYINSIIKEYEEKLSNNFEYIPLNLEIYENDMYDYLYNKYGDDFVFEDVNKDINTNQEVIAGENSLFNKIKLIGYAGMGKTTTVEDVIYKEALQIKNNNYQGKMPVLIELVQVESNSSEYYIENLIAKKLGTENLSVVNKLLENNMINLYLDGVNEIRINDIYEKRNYLDKLESFILSDKNKNAKIVITDRDNNANSILNNFPTFIISGVTKEKIGDFVKGNSINSDKVLEKINEAIEKNPALIETLRNAFMLKQLISIVECNKKIPEHEDDISGAFIRAIVDREAILKRDYNAQYIINILQYVVAQDAKNKNGMIDGNIMLSYYELSDMINNYCDRYKRVNRLDSDAMIDLIVKLGILKVVNSNKYTFVDESYYNFCYYEAVGARLL